VTIKITLQTDGPISLSAEGEDFPVLKSAAGDDIEVEESVFLCRCGASQNKPFCDWAHAGSGYSEKNECQNDKLQDFEAPGITVHFNRSICSGAAECVHSLPAVFKSASEDWIHPAEASVAEVMETVRKCPSGALTFTVGGKTEVKQEGSVSIRIVKNGPYEIKGPVVFDSPKWSLNASKTNFALCRCGKSGNNPFCDYSHGEQGWEDSQ
jgi:CDGSH-type Zn-finger protein/ferredoxin